jgi:UDP-N-acetyl-D-glucosamine dehydrogenase
MSHAESLRKIEEKKAVVGVVGLGYVGLPLLLCFAEKGFRVIGLDIDPDKVESLLRGDSYIRHIPSARIRKARESNLLDASTDLSNARECDAILLTVPTPLNRNREPDMSFVESTCESLVPYLRAGQLVVLESTT